MSTRTRFHLCLRLCLRLVPLALAGSLGACTPAPSVPPDWQPAGARAYEGEVRPQTRAGAAPMFRYERWEAGDDVRVSTHVTYAPAEAPPLIVQTAAHDRSFDLDELRVHDRQRGIEGRVRVARDRVVFERTRRGRTRTRTEPGSAPLVAGPTLFGWARAHWRALESGAKVPLRFAVVEDLRSYAFELRLADRDPAAGTTTLTLTATRPLVRVAVPTMRLVFDDATGRIRSYHGRVPPRRPTGGALDADVTYVHADPDTRSAAARVCYRGRGGSGPLRDRRARPPGACAGGVGSPRPVGARASRRRPPLGDPARVAARG